MSHEPMCLALASASGFFLWRRGSSASALGSGVVPSSPADSLESSNFGGRWRIFVSRLVVRSGSDSLDRGFAKVLVEVL